MGTYYELTEDQVDELVTAAVARCQSPLVGVVTRLFHKLEADLKQAIGGTALHNSLDRELQRMEDRLAEVTGAASIHTLAVAVGELQQKVELLEYDTDPELEECLAAVGGLRKENAALRRELEALKTPSPHVSKA